MFKIRTNLELKGDQKKSVEKIVKNINSEKKEQVLLGATGTGKTFVMANVIQRTQKPTLIIAQNKTLVMQTFEVLQDLFPWSNVCCFISPFDLYLPESYKLATDFYSSKRVQINLGISKMRLKTLNSLMTEKSETIVVASVASIYGCFNPTAYKKSIVNLKLKQQIDKKDLLEKILHLGYSEEKLEIRPGAFVFSDNILCLMPEWEEDIFFQLKFSPWAEKLILIGIEKKKIESDESKILEEFSIPPNRDYVWEEKELLPKVISQIENELFFRKKELIEKNKILESERLTKRIEEDVLNLREKKKCPGIENYSLYFDQRKKGESPFTIIDYFPEDFLMIIDESHITIPQMKAMYNTNLNRLKSLVENGFRLESCYENRPLSLEDFYRKTTKSNIIYVSATPGDFELKRADGNIIEQIIRPTGLLDPVIEVRDSTRQLENIMKEVDERKKVGEKVLIYCLTILISEEIANFLQERGYKTVYLHSRLDVFERYQAINSLRRGVYDVIVGINLLKEGIDLPEVSLVCILDADKSGFLRDRKSLIQIIGRASRNINGKVIFYAKKITDDMNQAIEETERRRLIQEKHNFESGVTPSTVKKEIRDIQIEPEINELVKKIKQNLIPFEESKKIIKNLRTQMNKFSKSFKFDQAIALRNVLIDLGEIKN